jgi:hypothetical protein
MLSVVEELQQALGTTHDGSTYIPINALNDMMCTTLIFSLCKILYSFHKSLSLDPMLSPINKLHIITHCAT